MRVIVTGPEGDIGKAIIKRLREFFQEPILATHRDCDVTDIFSVKAFVNKAWCSGGFDGLVCAHGAPGCIGPSDTMPDGDFRNVVDVDLNGTFRMCSEVGHYMLQQKRGWIVNVSSIHAVASYPQRAAYAAAKAGVCGLTRALAVEWASSGVYVNSVLPGQVFDTERTEKILCQGVFDRSPSGHLVHPEAVAAAVTFLLGSTGITGVSLPVDDGWLASGWFKAHTA